VKTLTNGVSSIFATAPANYNLWGATLDSNGIMWVSGINGNIVYPVTLSTGLFGTGVTSLISSPYGMGIGFDGTVYVSNYGTNNIVSFPSGAPSCTMTLPPFATYGNCHSTWASQQECSFVCNSGYTMRYTGAAGTGNRCVGSTAVITQFCASANDCVTTGPTNGVIGAPCNQYGTGVIYNGNSCPFTW
jgi:hypothetical protein